MRESLIEKHLVKRVKELGGEVRKVQWIGRNSAPDRLVMLPKINLGKRSKLIGTDPGSPFYPGLTVTADRIIGPMTIWVELKATGKKPTAAQLREHERMRKMGQHVEVIDSIEAVEELLK